VTHQCIPQLLGLPGAEMDLQDVVVAAELAALAATLTGQQVTQDRADVLGGAPDAASRLAASLNKLSLRLADLGRREDALAAIQEAAGTYRELAAARPDAFRPDLAMSLNNLAVQLGELGRPEEALAAIQEAVTIRRELAARWPDAYQHELEQSLRLVAWLEHGEDLSDASPREPKA
jgi:tetratricopeptide (TPR) repeat protein